MTMTDSVLTDMISSVELLKRTGISRATLNNYIKTGLLPRPLVKKPLDTTIRAKQIGYFPTSVVQTIDRIYTLKKEGKTIQEIIAQIGIQVKDDKNSKSMQRSDRERRLTSDIATYGVQEELFTSEEQTIDRRAAEVEEHETSADDVRLTLGDITYPAFLINHHFEIEWINQAAEERFFGRRISEIRVAECRNVFKLYLERFGPCLTENQEGMIDLYMDLYRSGHSRDELERLFTGITKEEVHFLKARYDHLAADDVKENTKKQFILLGKMHRTDTGDCHICQVRFREGILLAFPPMDDLLQGLIAVLSPRSRVIRELLRQRLPNLVSFCVLVADLQDSMRICAELPPEEYFDLINQIWVAMEGTFRKYYGIYGKHTGDGMVYYFLKERDSHYLLNAIQCALELREKMKRLNMDWKIRKGWQNDLFLNIGLNEGQEYFGTVPSAPNIEFTVLGDSMNCAGRLSDFAHGGSIWTTKNLMNKLTLEERNRFRFGIRRRDSHGEAWVENIYSRVMDLLNPDEPKYRKYMDIATLPITEIVGLKSGVSDPGRIKGLPDDSIIDNVSRI